MNAAARRLRPASIFVLTLLLIEFLDEFIFGAGEAAWPLIRNDLALTYTQIGLLMALPKYFGMTVELGIGVLGDVWKRRILILGGGVFFTLSLILTATSQSFWPLLLSFLMFNPSSGAFVGLSQASLMDYDPARHEHNMALWTFAGSAGVVGGSLTLGLFIALGLGWRGFFAFAAVLSVVLLVVTWRYSFNGHTLTEQDTEKVSLKEGFLNALRALKRREVLRWLVLLEFSDLMLDVLYSYLALYLVDVVGMSPESAAIGVSVWTVVGLLGDFLLIPLLERVRGLSYLRVSVVIELVLYPAFLLTPGILPKLVILAALGFFNSGWYSIMKGHLYSSMPGQSATVMTVGNVVGYFGPLLPLSIGLVAERFGLGAAMWLLLLGPMVLLMGIPRQQTT